MGRSRSRRYAQRDTTVNVRPGEVVLVKLNPTRGTEQESPQGGRPCLVIGGPFNWETLVIVVPLSTVERGWVTHVPVRAGKPSFALCEQVRSVDVDRLSRKISQVDAESLSGVQQTVARLIGVFR